MVMSSISRRRSELTGVSRVDWVIAKAPCWRSRDALLAAEAAQRRRDRRASTRRSTRAPLPRSGFVLRPRSIILGDDIDLPGSGRSGGPHWVDLRHVEGEIQSPLSGL